MVQAKLKKYGASYIFLIPPDIKEAYGLKKGKLYDLEFVEIKITTKSIKNKEKSEVKNGKNIR